MSDQQDQETNSVIDAALREYARLRELWIIICMMILPYSVIWLGMNFFKSAVWSLALYHVFCLLPGIVWGRGVFRKTLRIPNYLELLGLIFASVLFSFASIFTYKYFGPTLLSDTHVFDLLKTLGYSRDVFTPLCIYIVVVNPLLEELFWRGFVMNKLDELCPDFPHCGLIWSSFAYGAFHYPIMQLVMFPGWAEFGTIALMVYGAGLGVLYRKTNSVIMPALAHALLTDLSAVLLMLELFKKLNVQ
ncbi:MAG: CPBP family intramembrane metalloprotease [Candidatus Obscuribacterales bacterium]|nr:CPBP family intramembrane metalloprotease [Candidatus Obscuribacterales bacterium]